MTTVEGRWQRIAEDVRIGRNVRVYDFVNLYGCEIGDDCMIGPFVEIQRGVVIGRGVKIESHSFIPTGVTIEDDVFVGHGVMFINDQYPAAIPPPEGVTFQTTRICRGAAIGSNATILGGITVGVDALVGAGSVVTHDVPSGVTVAGNPARVIPSRRGQ